MTSTAPTPVPGFAEPDAEDLRQSDLPPVMPVAIVTLALIVSGGVTVAAQYGRAANSAIPTVLLGVAAVLLVTDAVLLARIREFAWPVFFRVLGWALLAYLVIAGILEYVFVYDHTPARLLTLFSFLLLLFAVDVPLMLAYSVARWQPVDAT